MNNCSAATILRQRYWGPRPEGAPDHRWRQTDGPYILCGWFEKVVASTGAFDTAFNVLFRSSDDISYEVRVDPRRCNNKDDLRRALNTPVVAVLEFEQQSDLRRQLMDWLRA